MPMTRMANPSSWSRWNACQPTAKETPQMTRVLTLSKTIRVVADISFVTEMPGKKRGDVKNRTVPDTSPDMIYI